MTDAALAFDWLCDQLAARTGFSRLESRGTVRIALKQAGLEATTLTARQLDVLLRRVLAAELTPRGVADAQIICDDIASKAKAMNFALPSDSPEGAFGRLGKL